MHLMPMKTCTAADARKSEPMARFLRSSAATLRLCESRCSSLTSVVGFVAVEGKEAVATEVLLPLAAAGTGWLMSSGAVEVLENAAESHT